MKEKFHEKMVECKVFATLEVEGILTLFSGFEEKYLGDALFKSMDKITLLEFKAISEGKSYSKVCNDEKSKFSNLEAYFRSVKSLMPTPHILVIGKLQKENFNFEGGNYSSFLEDCSQKILISSEEKKLKEWLLTLINKNATSDFKKFLSYVVILVKTRLRKEVVSGSSNFQEEVRKLLTDVKVVMSRNKRLFASTLGNLIVTTPELHNKLTNDLNLNKYIKHLKQNLQILIGLEEQMQNWQRENKNKGQSFRP